MHGIPSRDRVLKTGDVLSLDCGAIWEGYQGDSAVTVIVGDEPSTPEADKLVRVTEDALEAAIDVIRPGGRLSDIGAAIQQVAEGAGFALVREYGGHGIGRAMHEDPFIQNFGSPGRGPELKPGLVVAVEPMVMLGRPRDPCPGRRMDRRHGRRLARGPFRAHDRRHRGRPRDPHGAELVSVAGPPTQPFVDVRGDLHVY